MATVTEVIAYLQSNYQPEDHVAYGALWTTPDVIWKAAEMGMRVTQEEANNIIDSLEADCENGTTWDSIVGAIEDYPLADNETYDPEILLKEFLEPLPDDASSS